MTNESNLPAASTLPDDDLSRELTIVRPDTDKNLPHIGLVGDTYTLLLSAKETAGRYTLYDMHVPPCGGPTEHRHDCEEMFHVLEGEVEFTFRGKKLVARAGETVNIPANAPHFFHNQGQNNVRLLCLFSPAGMEDFFGQIGVPLDERTTPPPAMTEAEQEEFKRKAHELAPKYRTELL